MKGVILAGGLGSRLSPLTKITNKHLLPVGQEPMIWHPVRQLAGAGAGGAATGDTASAATGTADADLVVTGVLAVLHEVKRCSVFTEHENPAAAPFGR